MSLPYPMSHLYPQNPKFRLFLSNLLNPKYQSYLMLLPYQKNLMCLIA
jgi:hypothetical protein